MNRNTRVLVNCGCGAKFSRSEHWINLDFTERDGLKACNILQGLPLADASADAVFSSHMVEHLSCEQLRSFLAECKRVLAGGG